MATVWKVGTRWSDYGTRESSIFDKVFEPCGVAFANTAAFLDVCQGDYIAFGDGHTIVAVGKAKTSGSRLDTLSCATNKKVQPYLQSDVFGCRVDIRKLRSEDYFQYPKMSKLCHAPSIANKVEALWKAYSAGSCKHCP